MPIQVYAVDVELKKFQREWKLTVAFLQTQLNALEHQSNVNPDAYVRRQIDERAQNIRRVLVDMGELERSAL